MSDYIIANNDAGDFYAYYKQRFWWCMSWQHFWKENPLTSQAYTKAHTENPELTPKQFFEDIEHYTILKDGDIGNEYLQALLMVASNERKKESECVTAQNVDAAATTAESAAQSAAVATPITSESGVNASALTPEASLQNCESGPAASLKDSSVSTTGSAIQDKPLTFIQKDKCPEFDYSGLTDQTVENLHFAESEYRHGKQMAERGLVHMGNAIAAAHDALCGVVQQLDNSKHGNRGDDSFRAWCCSIGITKSTAYNLLQVSALMDGSSPRQRAILEALPPTLLYAVAKPSAPPELVEQVKNGEISSNKEYQALLKENQQLRTDRVNAMNQADRERNRADRAEHQLEAAQADVAGLKERVDSAEAREEEAWKMQSKAEARTKEAENQLAGSRQVAEAAKLRGDKLKAENDALKKQPITAVVDKEEVERQAKELAEDMAQEMTADLRQQLAALRSRINDDAQADFEQANYCASMMQAAWDNSKASYSRLVGEDLESTFQTICATLNAIREEASLLCRQPPDYDGGDGDE